MGRTKTKGIGLVAAGFVAGIFLCVRASGVEPVPRAQYLEYALRSADWTWDHTDDIVARWRERFNPENVFGYRPPGGLLEMAMIYAELYRKEKNPEHARRAKHILLTYGDFRSIYPESARKKRPDYADGVPVLPDFFSVMRHIRAYDILHEEGVFSPEECQKIEDEIAHSIAYLLRTQEWGPMNRTALRAESLAWAVKALPDHPEAPRWEMQRRALGDDNWGAWQIEDATIYHGIWLYAMLGYADVLGKQDEFLDTPEMVFYAHYFLNLMCPAGMIPDFGDANWMSNWQRFLVFFEAASRHYRDGRMKWAAATIARKFIDFENPTRVGLGAICMDCYLWGTDDVAPRAPSALSGEVMEDIVGKKIVFRNGWGPKASYLLLNYRDEGDGGLYFRDYLRDTIPVEEEKMTHGHADENSIVLLMSGGSVLLHDGGYRDYMPSGPYGAYRQDYFHNRLCVRPEKIWMGQEKGEFRYNIREAVPGQNILDFLRNAGSYRRVRTQKIDFLHLKAMDYSRTRVLDEDMGYAWDRVLVSVKDPELFVVFDVVKALREGYLTMANLWHTRKILSQGDHWYDTVYDRIQEEELPQTQHLFILFPEHHFRMEGTQPEKRHYQKEVLIHQTAAQHFELGETVGFVTLLIPHAPEVRPESWLERVRMLPVQPARAGYGVEIRIRDKILTVGVKSDLRRDMARDWRRPRYTYAAGRLAIGDFETNGDLLFAVLQDNRLSYTITNLTKALYEGRVLVEVPASVFGLAFDASPDKPGRGKLRYWQEEVFLRK